MLIYVAKERKSSHQEPTWNLDFQHVWGKLSLQEKVFIYKSVQKWLRLTKSVQECPRVSKSVQGFSGVVSIYVMRVSQGYFGDVLRMFRVIPGVVREFSEGVLRLSKGIWGYPRVFKSPIISETIWYYSRLSETILPIEVIHPIVLQFSFPRCYIHLRWRFLILMSMHQWVPSGHCPLPTAVCPYFLRWPCSATVWGNMTWLTFWQF